MRISLVSVWLLLVLCLVAARPSRAGDDGDEQVKKVGELVIVTDDDGQMVSATLVCGEKDEWDDAIRYRLKLDDKATKLAVALKGKKVVVTGTLKVDEDELHDCIVVSTIADAHAPAGGTAGN